jgi:hypothetical protein
MRATSQGGYTMLELLVVAGLIIVMAAVSLPAITSYIRNYTIRGATTQVAGEIQIARNKAIVKNVNQGVLFSILDSNTYRFVVEDEANGPVPAAGFGPLRDLPRGVNFVPSIERGFRFDRMGRWCQPGQPGCIVAMPLPPAVCPGGEPRCGDSVAGSYVENTAAGATVRVQEERTGLVRTITISPGGRVIAQR